MKVYVESLPKSCEKCGFCEYFDKDAHGKGKHEVACYFNGSLGNILYGNQTSPKTCPLKSLADYTKQVRKEVCEKIRKWCKENFDYKKLPNELGCWVAVNREEFFEMLDQIQGDR